MNICLWCGRRGQRSQCRSIETRDISDIVKVHIFWEIAILNAFFRAQGLVLVVIVFAVLGEAHSGKTLVVESAMVAAAQVAVATEDQFRSELSKIVFLVYRSDVASQFARR